MIMTAQGELVTKIQEKIPQAVVESLLSEFEHSQWKGRTILPAEMRRLLESTVTKVLQDGQAEMNAGIQASVKELGESIGKLQKIPVAGPVGGNAGVGGLQADEMAMDVVDAQQNDASHTDFVTYRTPWNESSPVPEDWAPPGENYYDCWDLWVRGNEAYMGNQGVRIRPYRLIGALNLPHDRRAVKSMYDKYRAIMGQLEKGIKTNEEEANEGAEFDIGTLMSNETKSREVYERYLKSIPEQLGEGDELKIIGKVIKEAKNQRIPTLQYHVSDYKRSINIPVPKRQKRGQPVDEVQAGSQSEDE